MNKLIIALCLLSVTLFAQDESEHGVYTLAVKNIKMDLSKVDASISALLNESDFTIESHRKISSPDRVREDKEDRCGFNGKLFVLTSSDYTKMLTSYGNKYLTGAFSNLQLIDSQNSLTKAKVDFINAEFDHEIAKAKLLKAIGAKNENEFNKLIGS